MALLTGLILPLDKRREDAELRNALDLDSGEVAAKRSAFWIMLTLAGIIATAGVLTDSTATVIGAMIIAPLSTPIMGTALGIVVGEAVVAVRSLGYVLAGMVLVTGIGLLGSLVVPAGTDLLDNSQIAGRTSPGLLDLLAALATGVAGAFALSRRDVADILPGVAIAISLVPPLGVVGVCVGYGEYALALGALVLFLSNVIAMIIAGSVVFTCYGFARGAAIRSAFRRKRAYFIVAGVLALVLIPLAANTTAAILSTVWTDRVERAAEVWVRDTPGADVEGARLEGRTIVISVRAPGQLPQTQILLNSLRGKLPGEMRIEIARTTGDQTRLGQIGN